MQGASLGGTWRAALVGVVAMAAVACVPTAPSGPGVASPKATETPGPAGAAEPRPTPSIAKSAGRPEKMSLKLGLAAGSVASLPIYLAVEHTFQDDGLTVEVVSFPGGARAAQALASDSTDIAAIAPNNLINLINAGQRAKGFYAGSNQAEIEWFARPEIKGWAELKGRSVGISSFGSLSDFITRYVLRKHGLEPERDVQLVQAGELATLLSALQAGKVDASILSAPFNWQAEAEGLTRLGTQATEVGPEWPRNVFVAKERFLDEHPNTVRALLRAHVKAIRLARSDREAAVQVIMKALKYERQAAERAYDDIIAGFDERGRLPAGAMPLFWEIAVAAGEVTEPWPESRFLDRRFVDSFDEWASR